MADMELSQAVRNAVEVERAASRFYQSLLPKAADTKARAFLEAMMAEEDHHAANIEAMGKRLLSGELPDTPAGLNCHLVETAPEWARVEEITLREALEIALEAEIHAELYYDAVADSVGKGPVSEFFSSLARDEKEHAKRLDDLLQRLNQGA